MNTKTINIQNIKTINLEEFLALLQHHSEIILMQGNTPIARFIGVEEFLEDEGERIPDLHPGAWVSDDFNDPLPDEFWLGEDT
jgi:hypothetical protein